MEFGVQPETRYESNEIFFFQKKLAKLDDSRQVSTKSVFNVVTRNLGIGIVSDPTEGEYDSVELYQTWPILWTMNLYSGMITSLHGFLDIPLCDQMLTETSRWKLTFILNIWYNPSPHKVFHDSQGLPKLPLFLTEVSLLPFPSYSFQSSWNMVNSKNQACGTTIITTKVLCKTRMRKFIKSRLA